jgi:hypothetical protein
VIGLVGVSAVAERAVEVPAPVVRIEVSCVSRGSSATFVLRLNTRVWCGIVTAGDVTTAIRDCPPSGAGDHRELNEQTNFL